MAAGFDRTDGQCRVLTALTAQLDAADLRSRRFAGRSETETCCLLEVTDAP